MAKLKGKLCGEASLIFSFDHGCLCARFDVSYEVYNSDDELIKSLKYGAINLNGSGNIVDPGGERAIDFGPGCWDRIKFKFDCLSAGDLNYGDNPCSDSFPGVGCHNGASGTFKVDGVEVAFVTVDTNEEAELDFCQIAGTTSSAP